MTNLPPVEIKRLLCFLAWTVISVSPATAWTAEVAAEIQAALEWTLPENECERPQLRGNPNGMAAISGTISHSATNTTAETRGTTMLYDADPAEINRYERKLKRWEACVRDYKTELLEQFSVLKDSARYGLTRGQAQVIISKLALIQAAVLSPDGIIRDEQPGSR